MMPLQLSSVALKHSSGPVGEHGFWASDEGTVPSSAGPSTTASVGAAAGWHALSESTLSAAK
jgi:hypothetical protein